MNTHSVMQGKLAIPIHSVAVFIEFRNKTLTDSILRNEATTTKSRPFKDILLLSYLNKLLKKNLFSMISISNYLFT